MKGQQDLLLGAIVMIVGGVIGFAILDSIMVTTNNLSQGTQNDINATDTLVTLTPIGYAIETGTVVLVNNSNGATVPTAQYTTVLATGILNVSHPSSDSTLNATWDYMSQDGYSSSLSRTIGRYLVPLGLLALLGMVAVFGFRR